MKKLEDYVRSIPDFPEKGIIFRDITSVLQDADGLHLAIDTMQELTKDVDYDVVVGPESRGFIFGTPLAYINHKPFVLIRKKGKLPCETVSKEYALEYGTAVIEMHKDSIKPGQKVLIVDDLIATGGTTKAMVELIESLGGVVTGVFVMMELAGLSFLGLGAQPPMAEWGSMMSTGRSMLQTYPWVVLSPGLAIFIAVVIFNLFGDSVRDYLESKHL